MSNLTAYFERTLPKPRYQFGDRVEGSYKGVPFVGTVGTDNVRSLEEGPMVCVHLDLPLKTKDSVHMTFVRVQYKDIKGLRNMLFTKSIVDKKAKLLYLMGATWHTKCMFDIDTVEPSFASLLAEYSIETYTFDYPGTGPVELDGRIGNRYQESIEIAKDIINQYKIEFIMGYSYGCILAQELSDCDNIRGVIMLDPQSETHINKKVVGNDKIYISKNSVREALVGVGSTISDDILDDYINSLTDTDTLVTALYPRIVYRKEKESFLKKHINVPRQIFATKNISPEILNKFTNVISYPDASHWIMLEQSRYQLAKDVDTFITGLL